MGIRKTNKVNLYIINIVHRYISYIYINTYTI